jgi:hypothetical protein
VPGNLFEFFDGADFEFLFVGVVDNCLFLNGLRCGKEGSTKDLRLHDGVRETCGKKRMDLRFDRQGASGLTVNCYI